MSRQRDMTLRATFVYRALDAGYSDWAAAHLEHAPPSVRKIKIIYPERTVVSRAQT
jgi:hypothetical protein